MDGVDPQHSSNWLRRLGLLCLLTGSVAVAIFGRGPLAGLSMVGGIIVLAEPYLTRRMNGS